MRCHVSLDNFKQTLTGKKKVWRTDGVLTHCCDAKPVLFIWEKSTAHNKYNGYSGYVDPSDVEIIGSVYNSTSMFWFLENWSRAARVALKKRVIFDEVIVVNGRGMGVAFFLHDILSGRVYSPYYDSAAGDMCCRGSDDRNYRVSCFEHWGVTPPLPDDNPDFCPCQFCTAQNDPDAWIESMLSATNWEDNNWLEYDAIPIVH